MTGGIAQCSDCSPRYSRSIGQICVKGISSKRDCLAKVQANPPNYWISAESIRSRSLDPIHRPLTTMPLIFNELATS